MKNYSECHKSGRFSHLYFRINALKIKIPVTVRNNQKEAMTTTKRSTTLSCYILDRQALICKTEASNTCCTSFAFSVAVSHNDISKSYIHPYSIRLNGDVTLCRWRYILRTEVINASISNKGNSDITLHMSIVVCMSRQIDEYRFHCLLGIISDSILLLGTIIMEI